ncbi:MAG: phosphatidate cytidylyltransferase [Clostridia bacterium]|nr:phosphatidate cytidylyltransferase [Clostridia bacterium]
MLVRIISSVVALPLLFLFVILGGIYLEVAVCAVSALALYEFYQALKVKFKPFVLPSVIFTLLFYILFHQGMFVVLSGVFTFYITVILIMYVIDHDKKVADVAVTILPVIYVIFFLYHVNLFGNLNKTYYIWLIFIVSWGADSGAYFIGNKFGKRKLAPTVSPKKSVEGAFGGMFTAALMAVCLSLYFEASFALYAGLIAALGSVFSIFGDLIASKIKREVGIKDYGKIMPGHGGAMDRFDSLILVTPFVYYAILLVNYIR